MKRRNFILKSGTAIAAVPFLSSLNIQTGTAETPEKLLQKYLPVNFTRDGLDLSPEFYSLLLQQLVKKNNFRPDSYGHNGIMTDFEKKVAAALGKESAVYMPTGTLANQIALRNHCITAKRAVVQYESHINRDSGDCMSNLNGVNLLTLGSNNVIFDTNELTEILNDSKKGKVDTPVGVISLETPVRRKHLKRIPFSEIEKIVKIARKNNIATHLDGARLFIDSAFSGKSIKDYTDLFDTVYLSLYKSFNSVGGAVLAGNHDFIKDLHHQRRMFGGTLPSSWQQLVIADYFFDNYEERYRTASENFKRFKEILINSGKFKFEELPFGSNIIKLIPLQHINPDNVKTKLAGFAIKIPNWNSKDKCFYLKINDSLNYNDINETAESFIKSI